MYVPFWARFNFLRPMCETFFFFKDAVISSLILSKSTFSLIFAINSGK